MEDKVKDSFIVKLVNSMSREDVLEAYLKSTMAVIILEARVKLGLNKTNFAKLMGVTPVTVSRWESCDCDFSISMISRICSRLGIIPVLSFNDEGAEI